MYIITSISDIFNQNGKFCDIYHEKRLFGRCKNKLLVVIILFDKELQNVRTYYSILYT